MGDTENDLDRLEQLQQQTRLIRSSLDEGTIADVIARCVPAIIVRLAPVKLEGIIIAATPLADSLFGYIEGELIGKDLSILIPARLRETHKTHFRRYSEAPSARAMGAMNMSLSGQHRDGSEFPVAIGLYPRTIAGERCVVATILKVKG